MLMNEKIVHTTGFVIFAIPLDTQVLVLAVQSDANATRLIQLARFKFKASQVKFVGIRTVQIYYQLKRSLKMLNTCSMRVLHETF